RHDEAEKVLTDAAGRYDRARLRRASTGLERAQGGDDNCPLPYLAATLARSGKPAQAWRRPGGDLRRGLADDLPAPPAPPTPACRRRSGPDTRSCSPRSRGSTRCSATSPTTRRPLRPTGCAS